MVILNHATMPDRTKSIQSGKLEGLLNGLTEDAKTLELCGADYIAIPCNTSHVLIRQLQENTRLPVINMIEAAVRKVHRVYGKGEMCIRDRSNVSPRINSESSPSI